MLRIFQKIIDAIARGLTRKEAAAWTPSRRVKNRAAKLIASEKKGKLSPDEQAELNHYLELEHIMRLAKARARQWAKDA